MQDGVIDYSITIAKLEVLATPKPIATPKPTPIPTPTPKVESND